MPSFFDNPFRKFYIFNYIIGGYFRFFNRGFGDKRHRFSGQGIIKTYPNYRDGYFRLATLEYELGNRNKAKEYVQKALELDPNFEEGRRLERMFLEK